MVAAISIGTPWLLIGVGAVVCATALTAYALPMSRMRIPTILAACLGALLLGAGLGIGNMMAFGYRWERYAGFNMGVELDPDKSDVASPPEAGQRMLTEMMKGRPSNAPSGRGALGPKALLAALVFRLDQFTADQQSARFNDQQKAILTHQLKELRDAEALSQEEAQRRLDHMLNALGPYRAAMEQAGFPWPNGQTEGRPVPASLVNPLKEAENARHLESILNRIQSQ
jgi:hypothetical protein